MTYRYNHIVAKNTIRLLVLKGGAEGDPLQCPFREHRVLDSHEGTEQRQAPVVNYTAVSYTWHSKAGLKEYGSIFCDGSPIKITKNVADLLRRIRSGCEQELWIDQICIDQGNEIEKSKQIPLMGKIYQQSREVLFWLGEENQDTGSVWGLVQMMNKHICGLGASLQDAPSPDALREDSEVLKLGLPTLSSGKWWPLMEFLQRGVFDRLWIVQEIVLGSTVSVRCGSHTMDFEDLACAALFLNVTRWIKTLQQEYVELHPEKYPGAYDPARPIDDIGRVNHINSLYNRRIAFHGGKTEGLTQLLHSTRWCKTSRKHLQDKVFALLGLLATLTPDGTIPDALLPSYNKTAEQVFQETTRHLLIHDSLDILSGIEDRSLRSPDLKLPSWVPNFAVDQNAPVLVTLTHLQYTRYAAGGPQVPPTWEEHDPNTMHLRAYKVDDVKLIGPSMVDITAQEFLEGSARLVDIDHYDESGLGMIGAFWRTLIGDYDGLYIFPAPVNMFAEFTSFCYRSAWDMRIAHELATMTDEGLVPFLEGRELSTVRILHELARMEEKGLDPFSKGGELNSKLVDRLRTSTGGGKDTIPFDPYAMAEWAPGLYNVFTLGVLPFLSSLSPDKELQLPSGSKYRSAMISTCTFRRCFTTARRRYFAVGPRSLQAGDGVFLLEGGRVPFVLRHVANNEYKIVGECYVHGIMHGEALRGKDFQWQNIRIT